MSRTIQIELDTIGACARLSLRLAVLTASPALRCERSGVIESVFALVQL